MKRLVGHVAATLVLVFSLSAASASQPNREDGPRAFASKGDIFFIPRMISIAISTHSLGRLNVPYSRIDCGRTSSCTYTHPPCDPWRIIKVGKDRAGDFVRVHPVDDETGTRIWLPQRLYGSYQDVLFSTEKACYARLADTATPSNTWTPFRIGGRFLDRRGIMIGPPRVREPVPE